MSDPVTNAEVEDVLSSIRRLVSEDKRPLQAQKPMPANDRLVLTPALRVADPVEDGEAETDIEPMQDAQTHEDEVLFDDPAHDYLSDPYNFADDEDEDGESDEALVLKTPNTEIEVEDEQEHIAAESDADTDEQFGLDDPRQNVDGGSVDATDTIKSASLSAKIEALETAIGNISDTWEPDDTGTDAYSGTEAPAMAWEDDVSRDAMGARIDEQPENDDETRVLPEAEATREAEPTPEAQQESSVAEDSIAFASDDQLIDEEALRDLVSDIVRAELQGALGERITRNVRKLVRREIHRALTAQDLE